jgi:hypothetical protein
VTSQSTVDGVSDLVLVAAWRSCATCRLSSIFALLPFSLAASEAAGSMAASGKTVLSSHGAVVGKWEDSTVFSRHCGGHALGLVARTAA